MTAGMVWVKIQERLNKLASADYDNITCWQIREAFNKAQLERFRRQVHGKNDMRESDEESRMLVDDLQVFIKSVPVKGVTKHGYFETVPLPKDYLYFKRITPDAEKKGCKGKVVSILREESNVDELLSDWSSQPSFEFEQTFHTIVGNRIRIYTNDDFKIKTATLTYFRKPREIDFGNCQHLDGTAGREVDPELKDDLLELVIDDTAAILAGDIESPNALQITKQRAELNT